MRITATAKDSGVRCDCLARQILPSLHPTEPDDGCVGMVGEVSPPTGQWACVWESADDPPEVRSRHSTRELAEQAVAAHDWPPPGEHTSYLCGYSVMRLSGGRWLPTEEEDDE